MKLKILFFLFICGLAGFFIGRLTLNPSPNSTNTKYSSDEQDCNYKYINPLRCENVIFSQQTAVIPLEKKLNDYISVQKSRGKVKDVAVYYRDLQLGPTININANEDFTPASLLKIPIMMVYYKLAETDPDILQTKIGSDYVPSPDNQNIGDPNHTIQPKTEYAVEELIEKMIEYSDNRSKELLLLNLQKINPDFDLFVQTINDLGIVANTSVTDNFITVKGVAAMFRILYNAVYLNNEMSEKALLVLSQADFKEGILLGLPPNTRVAHKFGDRIEPNGDIQRHDCGVVYSPKNNYLICVMTRGKNIEPLSEPVGEISKIIYQDTVVKK